MDILMSNCQLSKKNPNYRQSRFLSFQKLTPLFLIKQRYPGTLAILATFLFRTLVLVKYLKINCILNRISDDINTVWYRRKFASLKNLHLVGKAGFVVAGSGKIFAKNLSVFAPYYPVGMYASSGAEIIIGDVFLNQGVGISSASQITIEDETIISDMTIIMDTDWHGIDGQKTKVEPVHIGRHVWIGFRCTILKGVTIGNYSIIGAGSVVTHSVPSNAIFAGNPAKQIGVTKNGYSQF